MTFVTKPADEPRQYRSSCAANGCPLPGSISLEHGPNARYFCRFHHSAPPQEWDKITYRIRQNEVQAWDLFAVYRGGASKFVPKEPNETGHQHRLRAEMAARRLVLSGVSRETVQAQPLTQQVSPWKSVADIAKETA